MQYTDELDNAAELVADLMMEHYQRWVRTYCPPSSTTYLCGRHTWSNKQKHAFRERVVYHLRNKFMTDDKGEPSND